MYPELTGLRPGWRCWAGAAGVSKAVAASPKAIHAADRVVVRWSPGGGSHRRRITLLEIDKFLSPRRRRLRRVDEVVVVSHRETARGLLVNDHDGIAMQLQRTRGHHTRHRPFHRLGNCFRF